ncbi:MAG: SDR family NAD(P)-dependent oxidoreductase, partial [Ilumatobacter sp.]|nr:SDR family NAD(P)-dependent oxidoreductase [Ilumatobacter sp.]
MTAAPVTVVTGANSGIGRATALHLAEQGHVVYGTVRSTARAGKLLDAAEERGVGVELVELDIA